MMKRLIERLWKHDCCASRRSSDLFVATILVIGIIVGLSSVKNAVNAELTELANAILALSQGYTISGQTGCCASTDGSAAIDTPGLITGPTCVAPAIPSVIDVTPCP